MKLLLAPHNDDESLFAAFTLLRERPLVLIVTDSFIQPERGDRGCSALERRQESIAACKILGSPVAFLGIRDTELTEELVAERLSFFKHLEFERCYAPAIQGGNAQHDIIGKVAGQIFNNVTHYTTYTKTELWTKGTIEVIATPKENDLKKKALACYKSQLNLGSTQPHFLAVLNRSEWLI